MRFVRTVDHGQMFVKREREREHVLNIEARHLLITRTHLSETEKLTLVVTCTQNKRWPRQEDQQDER